MESQKSKALFQNFGFSLMELIVVIFIIAVISSVSIANFRKGEKQKQTALAADVVINAIRAAQNYTLAGKSIQRQTDPQPAAACRTPQYYSATVNYSGTIILQALNNNGANCGTTPDTIETYKLPGNTRIKSSGMSLDGTAATSSMTIQFSPPFGTMKANRDGGGSTSFGAALITVELNDGSAPHTITIDGISGRIGE